jgi:hypothetical protein
MKKLFLEVLMLRLAWDQVDVDEANDLLLKVRVCELESVCGAVLYAANLHVSS